MRILEARGGAQSIIDVPNGPHILISALRHAQRTDPNNCRVINSLASALALYPSRPDGVGGYNNASLEEALSSAQPETQKAVRRVFGHGEHRSEEGSALKYSRQMQGDSTVR